MGWRDRAKKALEGGHKRHDRAQKPSPAPNVPNVPNVPASPARVLKFWHGELERLDLRRPPPGFDARAWAQLVEDSHWLYEKHSAYAVRNGWDAQALFGVWRGHPSSGGLAQQLRSSRSLVLDGPRAVYRLWGVSTPVNIGAARGLQTIWEIGQ